jgi:hypothetical protein
MLFYLIFYEVINRVSIINYEFSKFKFMILEGVTKIKNTNLVTIFT